MTPDTSDLAPVSQRADAFVPLTTQYLSVGDGHEIYVETVGRSDGIPAVYLHGGPGSGCQADHRKLFDPLSMHAVLFDQRGAGRSRPKGLRAANTTAHLIADMESIREALGIKRWLVVGGSWGATLGLAYAQSHPDRVSGLVLRATFLGTRRELEWTFCEGLRRFHPGLSEDFLSILPEEERDQPLDAYWRRILDPDAAVHAPAARAWHDTERILSELTTRKSRLNLASVMNSSRGLPSTPYMEAHYFQNECFMKPDALLTNAKRLNGIPGLIVQSRYDLLCSPSTAHALSSVWQGSEVRIVEAAGHSLYDSGVRDAVVAAIRDLVRR